jgi:hypothetical protein
VIGLPHLHIHHGGLDLHRSGRGGGPRHDDGTTWRAAEVRRNGDGTYQAAVSADGYISLRVTAKGAAATVTETVIRALPPQVTGGRPE